MSQRGGLKRSTAAAALGEGGSSRTPANPAQRAATSRRTSSQERTGPLVRRTTSSSNLQELPEERFYILDVINVVHPGTNAPPTLTRAGSVTQQSFLMLQSLQTHRQLDQSVAAHPGLWGSMTTSLTQSFTRDQILYTEVAVKKHDPVTEGAPAKLVQSRWLGRTNGLSDASTQGLPRLRQFLAGNPLAQTNRFDPNRQIID